MALYTGRIDLGDAISATLRSDRPDGLFSTLVADERGTILGLAYSSKESIKLSLKERRGIYFSRSRKSIWRKGETSGDIQELIKVLFLSSFLLLLRSFGVTRRDTKNKVEADCDRDTLLFTVRQSGHGFCHRYTYNCFGGAERGTFSSPPPPPPF